VDSGTGTVLARGVHTPPMARVSAVVWASIAIVWTASAILDGEGIHWVLAVLATVTASFGGAGVLASRTRRLVVAGDELRLEQWWRSWSVRRADVVSIDGDVPGRPAWSESLEIETSERTYRVGGLDQRPQVLLPLLREWLDDGELRDS
jgi:hypothetical protein